VPVTNNSTGDIAGTGILNLTAPVVNTGTVSPGNPMGFLSSTPELVTGNTPTLRFRIEDGTGSGTGNDELDFSAPVDISGATLVVTANSAAPLQTYTIMTAAGPNGFIGNFALVNIPNGYTLAIDNTANPSTVTLTKTIITLPVAWGKFVAVAQDKKVKLEWTTLSESNTKDFSIEYSTDGRQFRTIGNVAAKGNSSSANDYTFTHSLPDLGANNFYRLKQSDVNGKVNYSEIRTVRFKKGQALAVQVVNPTRGMLQVSVNTTDISINLLDNNGRPLRKMILQPGVHQIDIQNLPSGTYQLIIYQKNEKVDAQQIFKY